MLTARQSPDMQTNSGSASTTALQGDEIMTHRGLRRGEQVQNTRTEDSCTSVTDEECGAYEAAKKKEKEERGVLAQKETCVELNMISSCGKGEKVRGKVRKEP